MEQIILISRKQRKMVRRLFGVSSGYLSMILRCKVNSKLAREIRQYCIGTLHASVLEERPP